MSIANLISSGRYNASNFVTALKNPSLFQSELASLVSYGLFTPRYGRGIDVVEEDWDNLVLLDACRYDVFSEENYIDGSLQSVVSKGPHSWRFIQGNFAGRSLHDTVYITANPHAERLSEDVFYTVETVLDQWDAELGTVLPEDVVDAAKDAHEQYPNKRLIIHFMQPHRPHLGQTAETVRDQIGLQGFDKYHVDKQRETDRSGKNIWDAVRDGHVDKKKLWQMYRETLAIVLQQTEVLLNYIDGRTVISADHGELLGNRASISLEPKYGHPEIYTPALCVVPWLEIEASTRRKIESEKPIGFTKLDGEVVNDRLEALGYISKK
jgi:hypothetical protein